MPNGDLNDTDRQKLDGIVHQMISNKESDDAIQSVVNDFKEKYGEKKSPIDNGSNNGSKTPTPSSATGAVPHSQYQSQSPSDETNIFSDKYDPAKAQQKQQADILSQQEHGTQPYNTTPVTVAKSTGTPLNIPKDFKSHATKLKEDLQTAVNTTVPKLLANKGLTGTNADPNGGNALMEKDDLEKQIKDGDLTLTYDKDGQPKLAKNLGFFGSLAKAHTDAWEEAANADLFTKSNTKDKLEYLQMEKDQKDKDPFAYKMDAYGKFIGSQEQPLENMITGLVAGSAASAAAPLTGGTSLAGLPAVAAVATSSKDVYNSAYKQEWQRAFPIIKQQHPDWTDDQIGEEADKQATAGGAVGMAANAALIGSGGEVSNAAKDVLANTLKGTAKMSLVPPAGKVALEEYGNLKGIKTSQKDIANDALQSFKDNLIPAIVIHALGALQSGLATDAKPQVVDALKNAAADIPKDQIKETLQTGEQTGVYPQGTTDAVVSDIGKYKDAKDAIPTDMPEEIKVKIVPLIQEKQSLIEEQKSKDPIFKDDYQQKINAIDDQIKKITTEPSTTPQVEEKEGISISQPQKINEPVTIGDNNDISSPKTESDENKDEAKGRQKIAPENGEGEVAANTGEASPNPIKFPARNDDFADKYFNESERKKFDAADDEGKKQMISDKKEEILKQQPDGENKPFKQENDTENKQGNQSAKKTEQPEKPVIEIKQPTIEAEEPKGNQVGVNNAALTELSEKYGLAKPEPGQYFTPEEHAERGKFFLAKGADISEIDNPNNELHDRISIGRAYIEKTEGELNDLRRDGKQNTKEYKDKTAELEKLIPKVKELGSKAGSAMTSLQGTRDAETDNFITAKRKLEEKQGKPLSKDQLEKLQKLTDENANLKKQISDLDKKTTDKTDETIRDKKAKKTHDQYVKERVDSFQAARDALKKLRSGQSGLGVSVPFARELAAIAPHVAKIVKSLIDEGIDKLGDIVDNIHDELSKDMVGLRRRDVVDLISGKYQKEITNEPTKLSDIKKQSKLVGKLEDLQNGLPEDFDSKKTEQTPEVKKLVEQIKKVKKDLADMGYMKHTEEPLTDEERKIKSLEKQRDDLQAGKDGQKDKPDYKFTEEQQKKVNDLQDEIDDLKKKMGITKSKVEKPLTESEQIEQDNKELSELQKQFADKKDNKFTLEEKNKIWDYAKKNYINKGVSYIDALSRTAKDIGLSLRQVAEAVMTPENKRLSDELWKKQYQYQKGQSATRQYIENQNQNPIAKVWKKITAVPRALATAFHGHIFGGTHYPMGFVTPTDWGIFFKGIGKMWSGAYGSTAKYEQGVRDMLNDKNYITARRAGLENDPQHVSMDDYERSGKILGRLGETGARGFTGLKWIRQQMFNKYWDKLSPEEQTPEAAKSLAWLMNNATGATNLNIPSAIQEGLFSAGMESARWGRFIRNPAEAAARGTRLLADMAKGKEIRPEDKVFAKVWFSRVGQQLGTMAGILAINAAIQKKINPKNPVNLTDPSQPDFFKIKMGDNDVDISGGNLGVKNLLTALSGYAKKDNSYTQEKGDLGGKLLQYGRGKLSPAYGDIADLPLGTDFMGNVLPFSDKKVPAGKRKIGWAEYATSKIAPIFVQDAMKNIMDNAQDNGVPKSTTEKTVNGLIESGLNFGAGIHSNPSFTPRPTPFTDADYKDPVFKYFSKDWGMELPNTAPQSEEIKDEDKGTRMKLSDYPKETQDKYEAQHKENLHDALSDIKDNGTVYVKKFKDAQGKDNNEVSLSAPKEGDYDEVDLDKLTTPEKAQVLRLAQDKATAKTKKDIFNQ